SSSPAPVSAPLPSPLSLHDALPIWRLAGSHGESVRALIGRVALVELAPPVLSRALEPFARPVRTLDALHLASMEFLRTQGQAVELATYDERLAQAARDLKVPLYKL